MFLHVFAFYVSISSFNGFVSFFHILPAFLFNLPFPLYLSVFWLIFLFLQFILLGRNCLLNRFRNYFSLNNSLTYFRCKCFGNAYAYMIWMEVSPWNSAILMMRRKNTSSRLRGHRFRGSTIWDQRISFPWSPTPAADTVFTKCKTIRFIISIRIGKI